MMGRHLEVQETEEREEEEIKWLEDSSDIVKWHLLCRNVDHLVIVSGQTCTRTGFCLFWCIVGK